MSKKSSKDQKKAAATKTKPAEELSEEQLEQVAGGASNYLLRLDGIKGESLSNTHDNKGTPSESVSLSFAKVQVDYKP